MIWDYLNNWIHKDCVSKELYNSLNIAYLKLFDSTGQIRALISEKDLEVSRLGLEVERLKNDLFACNLSKEDYALEYFWNHHIKPVSKFFKPVRDVGQNTNVVRFLNEHNGSVPLISGETNDEKANNALIWVHKNISYTSDKNLYHKNEFWCWADETILQEAGDCEDGAIVLANTMLKSGVPYWRVRLNAGEVFGGGHAYVTYLREKDDEWYVLDWCYYYSESANFKQKWSNAEKYYGIWYSFNSKFCFVKEDYMR